MNEYYHISIEKVQKRNMIEQNWKKLKDTDALKGDEKQYGYVEVECEKTERQTILEQSVQTINLNEVLKAVNNIK